MLTNKFAVLGCPVSHSRSPLLHNASYKYLGLEGQYTNIEVQQGELENFLQVNGSDFDAFSITMPLKEEAFDLALTRNELSSTIGVANTLIREGNTWRASNTDVLGFKEIFSRNFSTNLSNPLVLGSGSTAKSAILALSMLGVTSIQVMARNGNAVEKIENLFQPLEISFVPWGGEVRDVSVVISAVPEVTGISFDASFTHFLDVTYNTSRESIKALIKAPHHIYVDGLHLLVYQAAYQVLEMRDLNLGYYEEIVKVMFAALDKES